MRRRDRGDWIGSPRRGAKASQRKSSLPPTTRGAWSCAETSGSPSRSAGPARCSKLAVITHWMRQSRTAFGVRWRRPNGSVCGAA